MILLGMTVGASLETATGSGMQTGSLSITTGRDDPPAALSNCNGGSTVSMTKTDVSADHRSCARVCGKRTNMARTWPLALPRESASGTPPGPGSHPQMVNQNRWRNLQSQPGTGKKRDANWNKIQLLSLSHATNMNPQHPSWLFQPPSSRPLNKTRSLGKAPPVITLLSNFTWLQQIVPWLPSQLLARAQAS